MKEALLNTKVVSRRAFLGAAGALGMGVAAAGVAGCAQQSGQGSSTGASADASTGAAQGASESASASAPQPEAGKLSFVLDYTPNTNHTGIYVAEALGYYAEEGIELEIVSPPEDGADALIGTGGAQLGVTYQDTMANYLASESPLPYTAIAAIVQHNTSGIMSRAEDGITRPNQMEGHTYATWNLDVEQATVRDVVEADGGDFSKVELVPYAVDDDVAGLRSNAFDTVWVYEGWAVQNAIIQGFDFNYFPFIDFDEALDYYTPVIAANGAFLSEQPDVARAFLRATRKGYEYAISNPAEAAELLVQAVPELSAELVEASQEFLAGEYAADVASWGTFDPARWQRYYQWLNDEGLVEQPLDPSAGFTNEYLS